jgi:hypothetical protein
MTRMTRKAVALAVALVSVGTVTAFAATNPPLIGVTKSAMNGVNRASGAHGALKANAVGNRQIRFGSVSCGKLSADLAAAICTGKPGAPGTPGAPGADGNRGSNGDSGSNGGHGDNGSSGTNGGKGDKGDTGHAAPGVVVTHVTGPDSSVCGGDWANDDYTRTLQFIPQADGTIHVIRMYDGTFTTIGGVPQPSPVACPGTLQTGGVTGKFTGFDVYVVVGGNYNPNGECADNCTSAAMRAAFFPGQTPAEVNASGPQHGWEYHYAAPGHGTWTNADPVRGGNVGNITG